MIINDTITVGEEKITLSQEQVSMIERSLEVGVDEEQIPYLVGLTTDFTLGQLSDRSPELRRLFFEATQSLLDKVEQSLYARAIGFNATEREFALEEVTNKDGTVTEVCKEIKKRIRYFAPHVPAAQYILENHRPQKWKKRAKIDPDLLLSEQNSENRGEAEVDLIRAHSRELLSLAVGQDTGAEPQTAETPARVMDDSPVEKKDPMDFLDF